MQVFSENEGICLFLWTDDEYMRLKEEKLSVIFPLWKCDMENEAGRSNWRMGAESSWIIRRWEPFCWSITPLSTYIRNSSDSKCYRPNIGFLIGKLCLLPSTLNVAWQMGQHSSNKFRYIKFDVSVNMPCCVHRKKSEKEEKENADSVLLEARIYSHIRAFSVYCC